MSDSLQNIWFPPATHDVTTHTVYYVFKNGSSIITGRTHWPKNGLRFFELFTLMTKWEESTVCAQVFQFSYQTFLRFIEWVRKYERHNQPTVAWALLLWLNDCQKKRRQKSFVSVCKHNPMWSRTVDPVLFPSGNTAHLKSPSLFVFLRQLRSVSAIRWWVAVTAAHLWLSLMCTKSPDSLNLIYNL